MNVRCLLFAGLVPLRGRTSYRMVRIKSGQPASFNLERARVFIGLLFRQSLFEFPPFFRVLFTGSLFTGVLCTEFLFTESFDDLTVFDTGFFYFRVLFIRLK